MLSSPKLECYNNHEMLQNSVQLIIITFNGHKWFQFKNWKVDKKIYFLSWLLKSETGGKVVAKFANRAPIANFLEPCLVSKCQQIEITKRSEESFFKHAMNLLQTSIIENILQKIYNDPLQKSVSSVIKQKLQKGVSRFFKQAMNALQTS